MPSNLIVQQSAFTPHGESSVFPGVASRLGPQVVMDFYTWAAMVGAAFQVRAGTVTTPLIGSVAIAAAAAEYCVDCVAGTTLIPVYSNMSIRLAANVAQEYAIKSVAAVSTVGTAFVLLPLKTNGSAAASTARVAAAGGVTVTTELATTTRRHWSWSNPTGNTTAGTNLGIYAMPPLEWTPRTPPILVGPYCVYAQLAAGTAGPSYYASLDVLEFPTATLL